MPADLAIIVVTFNAREDVTACLASVHAHPPDRPWELVVVDNASADGTPEAVATRWPATRVIRLGTNIGFAAANNVGIAATTTAFVLLLNSDTIVGPGQIEALCGVMDAQPALGAAGPRLEDRDGRFELSWGRMMSPWAELRQKTLGWALRWSPPWIERRLVRHLGRARLVDWVSGACLLVRRDAVACAGMLDPRFFMYTEDVDFCAALRARGYGIRYSPEAMIVHLRGRSRAFAADATRRHYRASHLAFYAKHHPRWARVLRLYLRLRGQLPG
jgi:N-acetylglucosaminyl-diphospho-decaprenol L-rhamnosyltransferase